jgi:hypothetical protein
MLAPGAAPVRRRGAVDDFDEEHIRGDRLVFADPRGQELCAGRWTITKQAVNGSASASTVTEIEPP